MLGAMESTKGARVAAQVVRTTAARTRIGAHRRVRSAGVRAASGLTVLALLAACGATSDESPSAPPSSPSASATASAGPTSSPTASATGSPVEVTGVRVADSIGGFHHPWEIRFLPDGTPLVTERSGRLVAVVAGHRQVVAGISDVVARGEGGLMGLALDPDFASNRRIYTCYASGSDGKVADVRVVRFRLDEELGGLSDKTPLVTGIPAGAGNRHLGCRLEIGPDRMLWITTGDAVTASNPQDPNSLGGKVLRATLDGDPAPDNPGGRMNPYVFTMGHRNVQGLAFRPGDDTPFSVEHGTGCDDEVNLLVPGANYGWDPRTSGGGYAEQAPMTSPAIDDAVPAVWSSGCPTLATSGAEFLTDSRWGTWVGRLAVAALKAERLLIMTVDGDQVTDVSTALADQLGRLRIARTAPDGSLWVAVDADPAPLVQLLPETKS